MRMRIPARLALWAACLMCMPAIAVAETDGEPSPSIARIWNEQLLDAIRLDIPKPTVHARNLFHVTVAMWDAWAAYEPLAAGYLVTEKLTAADVAAARREAISYAAYRVLKYRYRFGPGEAASEAAFDAQMAALGYDIGQTSTVGDSPSALGNRCAAAVLAFGETDGANEGAMLDYADDSGYFPINFPLIVRLPGTEMYDPNRWQPLALDYLVTQNGIVIGAAIQTFINPNWGQVTPFALTPDQLAFPWVYLDPGPPPQLGGIGDASYKANAVQLLQFSSWVDPNDGVTIDISPGAYGNNTLGTNDGTGRPLNPYPGQPYPPNVVKRADCGRVIAELWADGPDSETPPGHWNTLANYVADHPLLEKRLEGRGPILDDLEWDLKVYLALNGAVHDAAVTAWGIKGHYDYSRPISHIRHMAGLGQSSDPGGPSYHPDGLPLVPGLIEVITSETTAPGQRHEHLAGFEGEIAVRAWLGGPADPETEIGGVGWIRAVTWVPYQRATFVTPAFAGYISGHSTFSRAGAEVLTAATGNPFFPGGLGTFDALQNEYLAFEEGPSETVELQFATYYDASDMAGISRLWGGIHPSADDLPGRIIGSTIGKQAWKAAREHFNYEPPVLTCLEPTVDADAQCQASIPCEQLATCVDSYGTVEQACASDGPFGPATTGTEVRCGFGPSAAVSECGMSVVDVSAPGLSVEVLPATLSPPDHTLVALHAVVRGTDNCGAAALGVVLESVTSSELDDAPGPADGDTTGDIQGAVIGTADFSFSVRAEAAEGGPGRVYTALYSATDAAGNKTYRADHVAVAPPDASWVDPISLMMIVDEAGTLAEWNDVPGGSYSVIRGDLHRIAAAGGVIDLQSVTCIEADSADTTTTGFEDTELPESDRAFFYLVEYFDGVSRSLGAATDGRPRAAGHGACP